MYVSFHDVKISMADDFSKSNIAKLEYRSRPDQSPVEWSTLKHGDWNGIRVQFRRMNGPMEFEFSNSGMGHRFGLLDLLREDGETIVDGGKRISNKDLRDRFIYCGPGGNISGWSKINRAMSLVLVEMAPEVSENGTGFPSLFTPADALTRSILLRFRSLLFDEGEYRASYVETLATMLRQETSRIVSRSISVESLDGGLTSRQLKLVISYMEDRLDQDISISDMARHISMSPFHFIRMFKKSAGSPPHKYLLVRRLEKAKEFLRLPHMTIAEVAERAGFGGVTQLERSFRRYVGTTPSSFRRQTIES